MSKVVFGVDGPFGRRVDYVKPGGDTFVPERDGQRLAIQLGAVRRLMQDGKPRSLREISEATGHPEASVSARLRDLRRRGHTIEREHVSRGLWVYRMVS